MAPTNEEWEAMLKQHLLSGEASSDLWGWVLEVARIADEDGANSDEVHAELRALEDRHYPDESKSPASVREPGAVFRFVEAGGRWWILSADGHQYFRKDRRFHMFETPADSFPTEAEARAFAEQW